MTGMDRDDRLAAAGAANHDVRATLPQTRTAQPLDDPQHVSSRHKCLVY